FPCSSAGFSGSPRGYLGRSPSTGQILAHKAAYIRSGRPDPGIKDLNESLRRDLDVFFLPYAYYTLGTALYKCGKYKRAQQHLDRAIALDPQLGQAYYYRAQVRRGLPGTPLRFATLSNPHLTRSWP